MKDLVARIVVGLIVVGALGGMAYMIARAAWTGSFG